MTDVKSWVEERRAIHRNRHVKRSAWSEATRDWAVEFPRALDALNAVLELHCSATTYQNVSECENEDEDHKDERHTESKDGIEICRDLTDYTACRSCQVDGEPVEWPCPTVQSIEGAINHA